MPVLNFRQGLLGAIAVLSLIALLNGCHMDAIVLPFVVLALWLVVRLRLLGSAVSLALAVGAKLWPVVLLPVLLLAAQGGGRTRARALLLVDPAGVRRGDAGSRGIQGHASPC